VVVLDNETTASMRDGHVGRWLLCMVRLDQWSRIMKSKAT